MGFKIHVSVRVKFRAFGVTLGSFSGAWLVRVLEGKPAWVAVDPASEPPDARTIHDARGVRVAIW